MFKRYYIVDGDKKRSSTTFYSLRFHEFTKNMDDRASLLEPPPSRYFTAFPIFSRSFLKIVKITKTSFEIRPGQERST
jgi:hypothetical protein